MRAEVIHGDCLDVMRTMPAMSVDAVVTDPPYGLKFMGKLWDHGVPGEQFWDEALRVAKPGAALLAFGGTRTFHRLAVAIEDGGWQIFDCLAWLYGQGFPKHRTHLKPAWEPIVFASKKGARFVNVEGCRLGRAPDDESGWSKTGSGASRNRAMSGPNYERDARPDSSGRWPANVCLDEEAARALDEQSGDVRGCASVSRPAGGKNESAMFAPGPSALATSYGDSGGASRFMYVAKASRADREDGLLSREAPDGTVRAVGGAQHTIGVRLAANHHPTVKPTDLMRWLCRLVTPPGGTVLDPFCGSGSTGVAANAEGFDFIGIEREAEYVEIARRRIANVAPLFAQGGAA